MSKFSQRWNWLLLDEHKIATEVVESMRSWKHSGFSVDNSVYVAKDDKEGMQRMIEYIARCPFTVFKQFYE